MIPPCAANVISPGPLNSACPFAIVSMFAGPGFVGIGAMSTAPSGGATLALASLDAEFTGVDKLACGSSVSSVNLSPDSLNDSVPTRVVVVRKSPVSCSGRRYPHDNVRTDRYYPGATSCRYEPLSVPDQRSNIILSLPSTPKRSGAHFGLILAYG